MTTQYTCELCKKEFKQKGDLTKHKNKKSPCISIDKILDNIMISNINTNNKTTLTTIFKYCLDYLRDNEHLTGDKALRNLSFLLYYKLLEYPIKKNIIDFNNYNYDFSKYDENIIENHKKKLLEYKFFSILAQEKEGNIKTIINYVINDIFSKHPQTKQLFYENCFDIKYDYTFKKLIDKINSINFDDIEYDILGEAYEEIIKDIMTGKVLGQFFTPPIIKNIIIKLIDPQLNKDGTCETIFDPAMGTGGFLISSIKYLKQQSIQKNYEKNLKYIMNDCIGGREAEGDTYRLALSNMLISTGNISISLEKDDSIRHTITNKYDIIMTNPPFGIKGLNYDDITDSLRNEYLPIKTNNAVPLFIQAIIYILKINGRCGIVLPDGQDLFSKSNMYVSIREYLMKTCDVKEIIYLPSGMFTHTSIKTCILYFYKKKEGKDVLDVNIKISKMTNKEVKREYKFNKKHQTNKIKFYDYNPENDTKNLLIEVDIKELEEKKYSLNYAEYLKDEIKEDPEEDNEIDIKTLEEVCDINYGTRIVKKDNNEGEYPVYGSGREMFTTNTFNRDNFNILIGRFALSKECIRFTNEKIFLNDSGLTIKPINNNILNHKYIGYYFYCNQNIIYECARGTAQKNLDMDKFKNLKIPIPSLKKQEEIVKYLDFINETSIKTSEKKIEQLKEQNKLKLEHQKIYCKNDMKTLGEICNCEIGGTPSRNNEEYYKDGKNLWVSIRELNRGYIYDTKEKITDIGVKNSNVKLFEKDTILFSFKLSIGKTAIVGNQMYSNEAIAGINSKNNEIIYNKYIYYYLSLTDYSKCGAGILGNGSLNKKSLELLKISYPLIEKQQEIVNFCEQNDELIKQLENEIERNKKEAKQYLTDVLQSVELEQNEIIDKFESEEDDEEDKEDEEEDKEDDEEDED